MTESASPVAEATAAAPPAGVAPQRAAIDGALHIPLALLKPSPTNPRKHFPAADLAELAHSLKTLGQLQPILARPAPGAKPGQPLYEIVAGERRWRACQQAQLPSIMAVVRDMTDFEVLEAQLIENLRRSDLTELEEAEGYRQLLRKPNGLQGYASADELAARIGKSRSYVFQRLKLLDLCDAGKQALADGKLTFSIALLIARLPDAADQAKATDHIVRGWGGEPYTYKAAEQWIHREFHLELDRAVFKITDATLVPEAGSCRDCPKRTGANPDLFADVKKADTCTDAACYHRKEDAHRQRLKDQAQARGIEVLSDKEAKAARPQSFSTQLRGWLALDKVHPQLGDKTLRKLLGKKLPEVKLLEDPHTKELVEVVREAEALALLKEAGVLKTSRMPGTSATERDAERAARHEVAYRLALAQAITEAAAGNAGADTTYRQQLLADVGVRLWNLLGGDDERRVERLLGWEHIGSEYMGKGNAQRKADRIHALQPAHFAQYLTAVLCAADMHVNASNVKGSKPAVLLGLAQRLGVDAAAIREDQRQLLRAKGDAASKAAAQRTPAPASAKTAPAAPDTPETALARAVRQPKGRQAAVPAAKYRCPAKGSTWSGRGLQPAWVKAALAGGATLASLQVQADKPAILPAARPAATLSAAAADPFRPQS